ncbi:MAG: FixH family protein [Cyclobacteriaceae bacterium]|nr:FixH family protein [Cyclobacteriaceae bacterium]
MNWGWKIVLLYGLFVIMTLTMVVFFMRQQVDLVADDYYKQEIAYQGQMDKLTNANNLKESLEINYAAERKAITVQFPEKHIGASLKGNIQLYRPSNADEDQLVEVKPSENGEQLISVSGLSRGLWKIKISWTAHGEEYYNEKTLTL